VATRRTADAPTLTSDFPPTLLVLSRKTPMLSNNVVVGGDEAQVRFMSHWLDVEPFRVDRITDETLLGKEKLLLHVPAKYLIDVSPEVRQRTGFWSADPITKGSAAINALVKFAVTLLDDGKERKREIIEIIGDEMTRKPIDDIRGAMWACGLAADWRGKAKGHLEAAVGGHHQVDGAGC
jgi:hypothetical protein